MLSNSGPPGKNRPADTNPAKATNRTQTVMARTRDSVGRRRGGTAFHIDWTIAAPVQVTATNISNTIEVAVTKTNPKFDRSGRK